MRHRTLLPSESHEHFFTAIVDRLVGLGPGGRVPTQFVIKDEFKNDPLCLYTALALLIGHINPAVVNADIPGMAKSCALGIVHQVAERAELDINRDRTGQLIISTVPETMELTKDDVVSSAIALNR